MRVRVPKSLALFSYKRNEASLCLIDESMIDTTLLIKVLLFPREYVGRVQITRNAYIVDGISRSIDSLWLMEGAVISFDESKFSDIPTCDPRMNLRNIYCCPNSDIESYISNAEFIDNNTDEHEVEFMIIDSQTCLTISPYDGSINYYHSKSFKMTGIAINDGSIGVVSITIDNGICVLLMEDNSIAIITEETRIVNYSIEITTLDLEIGTIDAISVKDNHIRFVVGDLLVSTFVSKEKLVWGLLEISCSYVGMYIYFLSKHRISTIDDNIYSWKPSVKSIKSSE